MAETPAARTLRFGPTNSYLLKERDGYLLIDTSYPAFFKPFLKELERLEVDPAEIKHLLLTHSHDDHAGFAAALREKTGCRTIAHKNAVESLKQGTIVNVGRFHDRWAKVVMTLYNWLNRRTFEYPPVTLSDKDIVVERDNEEILKGMGLEGRILYTPGHTDDGISIVLASGEAFVGDACMRFPGMGYLHYRPIEHSDKAQVFESWRKIIESGAKTIYPGHGQPFPIEELIRYKKVYAP